MTTQTVQEVATNVWAEIYEALTRRGVVFPDNFDGVGAAYAGHTILANALTQERTRLKEEIVQLLDWRNRKDGTKFHDGEDIIDWIEAKIATLKD